MKKKFLSILIALVLLASFSMVMAVPAAAEPGDGDFTIVVQDQAGTPIEGATASLLFYVTGADPMPGESTDANGSATFTAEEIATFLSEYDPTVQIYAQPGAKVETDSAYGKVRTVDPEDGFPCIPYNTPDEALVPKSAMSFTYKMIMMSTEPVQTAWDDPTDNFTVTATLADSLSVTPDVTKMRLIRNLVSPQPPAVGGSDDDWYMWNGTGYERWIGIATIEAAATGASVSAIFSQDIFSDWLVGNKTVVRPEFGVNRIVDSVSCIDDYNAVDIMRPSSYIHPVQIDDTDLFYPTIQKAIDSAIADEIISVAAGEYAGAVVDKSVTISGVEGGASVITSGVQYRAGNDALQTAFRPEADGAEIRNFTIDCGEDPDLAVYARGVDNVTVDSLVINTDGTVQGITNWGGSGWEITHNVITNTVTLGGGGIGIFLGAMPPTVYSVSTELRVCTGNLIQLNKIAATATAETYSCAGIAVCLDTRYGGYANLDGSENVSGNQILDNIITSTGANNAVGIEVGTILGDGELDPLRTNPAAIAAIMAAGAVHDNLVQDNSIDGAETGVYFYNVTDLTVTQNKIVNSTENGIYVEYGHSGVAVNCNNIYGNVYGLEHEDIIDVDYGSIDALHNWWGDASGPDGAQSFPPETYTGLLPGTGNKVSAKVKCKPWLTRPFEIVLEDDIAYFGISSPALKGWNIVSAPLALDANVTVTVEGFEYKANTWGGLQYLGKIAEGDKYALKLHYTMSGDTRVYSPIYYYDSDPASLDKGWRKANELTEINPVDAFYIRMEESDSIPILFSPDRSVPSKTLYKGWNLVGCAYMSVLTEEEGLALETALATIESVSSPTGDVTGYDQVVSPSMNQPSWTYIPSSGTYIPESVAGDTILIGKGYWVFMENQGTLAGLTFTPISLP